jgi:hypothetical protein
VNDFARGYGYRPAHTVAQFCADHNISRTHFYQLIKDGKGPRLMKLGRRVLISAEAAADWRGDMERGAPVQGKTTIARELGGVLGCIEATK